MTSVDPSKGTQKKARTYHAKSWWHKERDKKLLFMHESGMNAEAIAVEMHLDVSTVYEILKLYRENEFMRR